MARINVLFSPQEPSTTLDVNGRKAVIPSKGEAFIADDFLPALRDSNIQFEILDGPATEEAGEALGGITSDSPAETPIDTETDAERAERERIEAEDAEKVKALTAKAEDAERQKAADAAQAALETELAPLLDQNAATTVKALAGLAAEKLTIVRALEANGKNRATVLKAIDAALNPPAN